MKHDETRRDYPLNQWYCAAFSDEVSRKPLGRTLCDRQVVVYRTEAGAPVALTDRCPHRKAPLSGGMLIGDVIECPFHGMQFAPDGQCVHVPSQEHIPATAQVRSYALDERHGHVWIWMGEAAPDHDGVPDMHWLTDPALTAVNGMLPIACNYLVAIDNLLDDTHLSFVHRNSIGTPKIAKAKSEVSEDDKALGFTRWTLDTPPSAMHARAGGFTTNVDRWFTTRYVQPSTVLIDVGSAPIGSGAPEGDRSKGIGLFSNGTVTPSTSGSCFYFWHTARNFNLGNEEVSAALRKDMVRTFEEDVDIVETVQRSRDCDAENLPQINLAADVVTQRMRRIVAALVRDEERGRDGPVA